MINKVFLSSKLLISILIVSVWLMFNVSFLFAAEKLFEADGDCIVGNIGIEDIEVAKNKAKERAINKAIEEAGITIESITEMKNNMLTKDEIKIISRKHLRIADAIMSREFVQNEDAIKYICHVKVWIDTDEVVKDLPNSSIEKITDQVKMTKDQEGYLEKNETEIVNLREQYKKTNDDNKRQEIVAAIKHKEEQFTATQLYQQGADCYNKGNLAEAINFYNQAIEKDEKYAAPLTGLGWIYNDQGQYAKAIEYFQKSIALYSDIALPYNGLSYAYNYNKDYQKAIEYGNKAVQIDPNYASAWNNIGFAYNNLGDYGKAIEYYNKAMAIAPNDEVPFANIGNVYYKQKNFEKALEYYIKSTNINGNHANVWYHLGNIYGQKKEINKAIESYKKSTALDPQNIRAWIMSGYLNNQQKNFEDAKKCFKKALKLDPNNAAAWEGLGIAYDGSEDYSNALDSFKKAVELEPANETYKKNLELAKSKM